MSTSDFGETAYLTAAFEDGTVFTDIYIGLSTTAPADDNTNVTEPSGNGYARIQHSDNTATPGNWTISGDTADNLAVVDFGTASGSWGTISHFVIYDALTVGNLLHYGTLSASKAVATDDQVQFSATNLAITAA